MSAHTKDGPWIDAGLSGANPVITGGPLRLIKCAGVVVAFLPAWLDDEKEEAKANARLIAAAPDLLEALQLIVQWDESGFAQTDEQMSKARAAISKATGEQA
jgi:hypothetical protein